MLATSKIMKSTLSYTVVSLLGRVISIPKGIIVGLVLLPSDFGLYNSIYIWFSYLTIVNIGLCTAGSRESAHYFGLEGEESKGVKIQNRAVSFDFLIMLVITVAFIIYSLQQPSLFLIACYVLVGVTYFLNQIGSYYERFNSARNKFVEIARANLVRNVVAPLLIMATIYYLKIYALFIVPIVALIVMLIYYGVKLPINFRFNFDRSGMGHLAYAGLFFGAGAMLSNLYYVVDRTFINMYLDNTVMGLYSFSMMFVMMIQTFLASFQGIFIDAINKNSSDGDYNLVIQKVMHYNRYLLFFTFLMIIVSQLGYYFVVEYFVKSYRESNSIFTILSTMMIFYAIFVIHSPVMASKLMRKENYLALIMLAGVVSAVIFNGIFVYLGWGGEGIALGTVISQAIMSVLTIIIVMKNYAGSFSPYFIKNYLIALFLIIYSGFFYYFATNHYPAGFITAYCISAVIGVLAVAQYYYKFNPFRLVFAEQP